MRHITGARCSRRLTQVDKSWRTPGRWRLKPRLKSLSAHKTRLRGSGVNFPPVVDLRRQVVWRPQPPCGAVFTASRCTLYYSPARLASEALRVGRALDGVEGNQAAEVGKLEHQRIAANPGHHASIGAALLAGEQRLDGDALVLSL